MRFFIATKSGVVVRKEAVSGDDQNIDAIIDRLKTSHPDLVISEVDEPTFNGTLLPIQQTQAQKDWATFKATSPTAQQAIVYLAKYLGLE